MLKTAWVALGKIRHAQASDTVSVLGSILLAFFLKTLYLDSHYCDAMCALPEEQGPGPLPITAGYWISDYASRATNQTRDCQELLAKEK